MNWPKLQRPEAMQGIDVDKTPLQGRKSRGIHIDISLSTYPRSVPANPGRDADLPAYGRAI